MGEGPSSYLNVTIDANEVPTAVAAVASLVPEMTEDDEDAVEAAHAGRVDEVLTAWRVEAQVD